MKKYFVLALILAASLAQAQSKVPSYMVAHLAPTLQTVSPANNTGWGIFRWLDLNWPTNIDINVNYWPTDIGQAWVQTYVTNLLTTSNYATVSYVTNNYVPGTNIAGYVYDTTNKTWELPVPSLAPIDYVVMTNTHGLYSFSNSPNTLVELRVSDWDVIVPSRGILSVHQESDGFYVDIASGYRTNQYVAVMYGNGRVSILSGTNDTDDSAECSLRWGEQLTDPAGGAQVVAVRQKYGQTNESQRITVAGGAAAVTPTLIPDFQLSAWITYNVGNSRDDDTARAEWRRWSIFLYPVP